MDALDYLRRVGLAVELEGERLRITPADRITANLRQFIRDHRTELVAELSAAYDAQASPEPLQTSTGPAPIQPLAAAAENTPEAANAPRRAAWPISRDGKQIGYMVGLPITYAEALAEARWRWPDANIL